MFYLQTMTKQSVIRVAVLLIWGDWSGVLARVCMPCSCVFIYSIYSTLTSFNKVALSLSLHCTYQLFIVAMLNAINERSKRTPIISMCVDQIQYRSAYSALQLRATRFLCECRTANEPDILATQAIVRRMHTRSHRE